MIFVRPYRVDVIIPIHNAPEYVARCIASIQQSTCSEPHLAVRILLINDASSDSRVQELLDDIVQLDQPAERHADWQVLHNTTNQGFVRTVNRGMALDPSADVILLNSDTQVTPGWLPRLVDGAYSAQDIATVTALSNTASIYSWPLEAHAAALPAGRLAQLVAQHSPKLRPTIPTGVGSCLYIKRSVLNTVGLFDESYGRGYEEENDFCMRATRAGYRHILADDVFVWHKGQASMTAAGYVRESNGAQKNEDLSRDRQRILFVLHNPFGQGAIGGTEFHVEELVRQFSQKTLDSLCYVLYPRGDEYVLEAFADAFTCRYTLPTHVNETFLEGILRGFGIDIVHI